MARSIYAIMAKEQSVKRLQTVKKQEIKLISNKPDHLTVDKFFSYLKFSPTIINKPDPLTVDVFFNELQKDLDNDFIENFSGLMKYEQIKQYDCDICYLPTNEIKIDAKKFQFKLVCGKSGSTGSLSDVKIWNNELSGLILVWFNPSDKKTYVINGHNRVDLAIKKNIDKIAVKYISAKNSQEARLKGALCNIAEGNGTIYDVAKLFKDSSLTIDDLKAYGINIKNKLASDGLALSQLSNNLFDKVMIGSIPVKYGIVAGNLDQNNQQAFIDFCLKKDTHGDLKESVLNELGEIVKSSEQTKSGGLLFDIDEIHSYAIEKSVLIDYCLSQFKKDKQLFKVVSNSNNKDKLEFFNNKIDISSNEFVCNKNQLYIDLFNQFKNVSSNSGLCQTLNRYAKILNSYSKNKDIMSDCYNEVINCLNDEIKINKLDVSKM